MSKAKQNEKVSAASEAPREPRRIIRSHDLLTDEEISYLDERTGKPYKAPQPSTPADKGAHTPEEWPDNYDLTSFLHGDDPKDTVWANRLAKALSELERVKADSAYWEKHHNALQRALNQRDAQEQKLQARADELLAAAKFAKCVLNAKGGHTAAERDEATRKIDAAIAKAESRAQ